MQVNKESIKKVARIVEEEGNKPSSFYNFDKILDNFKLRHDCDMERTNSVMICCPFHSDADPSLSINYERKSWYCFGCGKSGDTLQFLVELDRVNGNDTCTRASKANDLLRENPNVRALAGFDSVYVRSMNLHSFEPVTFKKRSFNSAVTPTFSSVADKVAKKNDYALVERAILMMQKGFTPELIADSIFTTKQKKQYSIEELWS